jgi:tetratricopeptide (TPR) repeat protein
MAAMDDDPIAGADQAFDAIAHLVQAGNWPAARAQCEELLAAEPANADALVWLGRIAMGQFRWDDAIAAFDQVLRIRVDPWTLGNLGVCHWKVGHLDEAEYCLRGAVEVKPDFTRAHVSLANVLHALKRFDDALAQLALAEKLDARDHQIPMRRGCALAALGRYDEAQQMFVQSVELAGRFSYPRLVAFDRATFDAVTAADEAVPPPRMALHAGAPDGGFRYVTLISCNPPYVRKYGFPFIRSFAECGQGASLLHLHIYDPDETILDEVQNLMSTSGLAYYAVTTETCPFPAHETKQRKAYYACGRLVHLPHWLDHYQRPLLSLDVDFIVESTLDGLIAAAQGCDVGLNPRDPVDSPWLDVIANIIVANPTMASRHYFAAVKNYALGYLRREREAWLVDQSALYCVLKMMERFAAPPSVAWLPADRQACLWHIGHAYDHLLDDPRYRKYADAPAG